MIRTAREINDNKPNIVVDAIIAHAKKLNTKKIICLGAAYKPDIADLRESPALKIILKLASTGYSVKVVESNIDTLPESLDASRCQLVSLKAVIEEEKEQVISILVAHKEFKISKELRRHKLLDFCGVLAGTY